MRRRGLPLVLRNMLIAIGVGIILQLAQESLLHASVYKLALNEEPGLCEEIQSLSERGLLRTESLENAERRPTSKEITFIEWGNLNSLSEELAGRRDSFHSAIFDIDNDGQLDWVVKEDQFLSSQISESLLVFRHRTAPSASENGISEADLRKADGSINFTGQSYFLKKLPKFRFKDGSSAVHAIGGVFKLIPFRFRNVSYLLIANPFQEQFLGVRKVSAIVKYSPRGELDDVCYVETSGAK